MAQCFGGGGGDVGGSQVYWPRPISNQKNVLKQSGKDTYHILIFEIAISATHFAQMLQYPISLQRKKSLDLFVC